MELAQRKKKSVGDSVPGNTPESNGRCTQIADILTCMQQNYQRSVKKTVVESVACPPQCESCSVFFLFRKKHETILNI